MAEVSGSPTAIKDRLVTLWLVFCPEGRPLHLPGPWLTIWGDGHFKDLHSALCSFSNSSSKDLKVIFFFQLPLFIKLGHRPVFVENGKARTCLTDTDRSVNSLCILAGSANPLH